MSWPRNITNLLHLFTVENSIVRRNERLRRRTAGDGADSIGFGVEFESRNEISECFITFHPRMGNYFQENPKFERYLYVTRVKIKNYEKSRGFSQKTGSSTQFYAMADGPQKAPGQHRHTSSRTNRILIGAQSACLIFVCSLARCDSLIESS